MRDNKINERTLAQRECGRRRGKIGKILFAVFAVVFVISTISTISAFAAANLFKIENAELTTISATAEGNIESFDEGNIVSNVTFHRLGDTAEYAITLQNTDTKDHIIESIANDNENEFVIYEHDSYANTTVAAGADFEFVVTAKYANSVTDMTTRVQATNVKFIINYKDIEPETISINPNTADNIWNSVTALIISAAGLIVCAIIYAKNHKKFTKVLGAVIALVATATIFAGAKAVTVEINSFTITTNYNLNNKVVVLIGDEETVIDYGDTIENAIPTPDKTGYIFEGWTDENDEDIDPTNPIYEDVTIKPKYTAISYKVRFNANGADGEMSDQAFIYDEAQNLTANGFSRTGYVFGGWKYNNEDYEDGEEVINLTAEDNGEVEMVAQWQPTQYTIIFHANNENVENPNAMAAQVVAYDEEVALNANTYTWWQHKIVEWTTNENGTGTKYADKAVIKNLDANGGEIHLYAKWREIDAALDGRGSMTNKGINTKLKAITTANPDAKNFLHYPNGEPSDEIKASATDLSGTIDPIYAWVDGENIYWWSEDVKPRISTNNSVEYHYYGVGKSTAEGNVNNLEYMDLTGFDTTGIVGARSPFEYTNIRRVDISDWDLSNATDMSYFAYASKLEDITFPEHFDVQKVTSLNMAFAGAKLKKLDLRGWKTRDLRALTNFIQSMPTITEVTFGGDFKTDNVTSMSGMINANANLATINNINTLNTAKVTSMRSMFDGDAAITSLDLSAFDTTALTDMAGMFKNMSGLTSLTLKGSFTAANVTNMEATFYGVKNINTIDLSNLVSKPTNLKQTFAFTGGGAIETIDISNMDLSDVTTVEWTFFNANSGLKTIYTSSSVNPEVATNNTATFQYDTGLVGGANTHTYDVGGISSGAGSRIDDPDNGKPGYFTYKNARYIRYHDNDGDNTNDEANYALMTSHYLANTGSLKVNAFTNGSKTFIGWNTAADGSGDSYTDGQAMADLTESKTPLELYAQWEEASSGSEYEAMQSMTTAKCAAMEVGTMVNLQDTRDNKVYRVGKLADNNCWMLDTLKIANVEISDEDSDLPEGTTFVLPDSNDDAFEQETKNTPKLYIDPINNHGVFYSYYTATAGWGVYGDANLATTTTDSPQSICPKGWKLPNGGNSYAGDFNNLVDVYGRDQTAYMGEFPGFELDGALYSSNGKVAGPADYGHNGYFWSSTNRSKWFANRFLIIDDERSPENSGIFYDFNYYKYWENNIVCIAR